MKAFFDKRPPVSLTFQYFKRIQRNNLACRPPCSSADAPAAPAAAYLMRHGSVDYFKADGAGATHTVPPNDAGVRRPTLPARCPLPGVRFDRVW